MGEITICFTGICSHLENVVERVPHRVVLIHEEQDVTINRMTIRSHAPRLKLKAGSVVSGTLPESPRRVSIRLLNGTGEAPSYDQHYRCAIPKLQQLTNVRLVPKQSVVAGSSRPAGVYFDVDRGSFSAGHGHGRATAAIVTVQTEGNPRLLIESMEGLTLDEVELGSGAIVELRNSADGPHDHQNADFLLHYELFESVPADARVPTAPPVCPGLPALPFIEVELGPGCSNSSYP